MEYITKYELAEVVGLRALQIQQGEVGGACPLRIATEQVLKGEVDLVIRRSFPGGRHVDVPVRELKLSEEQRSHLEGVLTRRT